MFFYVVFENRKSSTLSELNANKRVPVLQDEELSLFESSAILRYLANKYAIKRFLFLFLYSLSLYIYF